MSCTAQQLCLHDDMYVALAKLLIEIGRRSEEEASAVMAFSGDDLIPVRRDKCIG